jgi:hypothetical protein
VAVAEGLGLTNAELNAAVYDRLCDMGAPPGMQHTPTHPWANNLLASVTLLEDDVLCHVSPVTATVTIVKQYPEQVVSNLQYTCRLDGMDEAGRSWYCEATSTSLPRAICLAYIQVREEEAEGG